MSKFNERFRILKEESEKGIVELSKMLGITQSNITYYLKDRDPSTDMLIKIASEFNVSVDWLIGFTDYRSSKPVSNIPPDTEEDIVEEDSIEEDTIPATKRALDMMVNSFPADKEAILKEAESYKSITDSDSLFPNSDSYYGGIYDDATVMYMTVKVFRFYIKCITDLSNIASISPFKETYDLDDMIGILDNLQMISNLLSELMVNYNYHVANSLCETLTSPKDYNVFKTLTSHEMRCYHDVHSENSTVYAYDYIINSPFFSIVPPDKDNDESPDNDPTE